MNYFRCTVGGGKGNTVTVTCAEEFAGLTITLAKTGKTYTKTCPSTAPYEVTFYGVENGTYTVSCTVDGQTYSETVIVQDISCVLNYGFNWQIWVDTASQLDSSDYDTLDEVLADEKALRELFLEHACVDYMASVAASNEDLETVINDDYCAKWINNCDYALDFLGANTVIKALMDEADKYGYGEWALMPQVPTMTSNTAPYGVASAESYKDNNSAPWYAFDGNDTTNWRSAYGSSDQYIQYEFPSEQCITALDFLNATDGTYSQPSSITILVSADNSSYTLLETFTNLAVGTKHHLTFNNTIKGKYVRVRVNGQNNTYSGGFCRIDTLQFYAWAPKGNVPIMTSNTAPYGTASASNASSGYEAYRAFSDVADSRWVTSVYTNAYIQYKSVNPINVRRVTIRPSLTGNGQRRVKNWKYQASNDGTTFVDVYSGICEASETPQIFDIQNDNYYLYHRILVVDTEANNITICILDLQFYGRELKVSVPKMTSNTAPYGEVIYSSTQPYGDSAAPYKPFNGGYTVTGNVVNDIKGGWYTYSATDQWLGYDFMKATKIRMVAFKQFVESSRNVHSVNSYKIQYSDDNSIWEDAGTSATSVTSMTVNALLMEDNIEADAHRYWRMKIESGGDSISLNIGLAYIQFYGLDYSEKEFEVGTTKKWLYDHGVELEELNAYYDSSVSHGTVTKNESSMILDAVNNNGFVGAGTEIDLTAYTRAYTKMNILSEYSSGNGTKGIRVGSLSSGSVISSDAEVGIKIWNPYQLAVLDISNFNQVKAICSRTYVGKCTLFELWLE